MTVRRIVQPFDKLRVDGFLDLEDYH